MRFTFAETMKIGGALVAVVLLLGLKHFSSVWAEKTSQAVARLAGPPQAAAATSVGARADESVAAPSVIPPNRAAERKISVQVPITVSLPDYDRLLFRRHLKGRFPRYHEHFREAADKHGISWKLLAAQAYQESHWNWRAKSPTGVRGIMMLTRRTAASLGVKNRLDPVESIHGGARYLSRLERRLPSEIHRADRTLFALAAYNVGLGHVKDARVLARRQGMNPNRWRDLQSVLPLLSVKRYYKALPHGYARGHEPVRYVKHIREYRSLLDRHL